MQALTPCEPVAWLQNASWSTYVTCNIGRRHDALDQRLCRKVGLSIPVHIFWRQTQQANQDAASKLRVKLGLVINDMDKALDQVELHMEVGEIGWNAAFQTLGICTSDQGIVLGCMLFERHLLSSQVLIRPSNNTPLSVIHISTAMCYSMSGADAMHTNVYSASSYYLCNQHRLMAEGK